MYNHRSERGLGMKWLNVKDNPPLKVQGMKVIGYGEDSIFEAEYDDGYWCNVFGIDMTHWMPLPSPPTNEATS